MIRGYTQNPPPQYGREEGKEEMDGGVRRGGSGKRWRDGMRRGRKREERMITSSPPRNPGSATAQSAPVFRSFCVYHDLDLFWVYS